MNLVCMYAKIFIAVTIVIFVSLMMDELDRACMLLFLCFLDRNVDRWSCCLVVIS
jgi:hypothetical protein